MLNITRKVTNIFHRQGEYLHLNYRLMQYLLTEKTQRNTGNCAKSKTSNGKLHVGHESKGSFFE